MDSITLVQRGYDTIGERYSPWAEQGGGALILGFVFCSQFCSQPEGILETIWKRYEYTESQNSLLNSIAG